VEVAAAVRPEEGPVGGERRAGGAPEEEKKKRVATAVAVQAGVAQAVEATAVAGRVAAVLAAAV
jgi:hypothetical protein